MALRHRHRIIPLDRAENRNAHFFQRFLNHRAVGVRTETIQNHAREIDLWIVLPEAHDERRRRLAHRLCVDDKQHGRFQQFRDFRRGTDAVFPAVIEPHHAFDNRHVSARHRADENIGQPLLRYKPCVEIVRRPAAGQRMIARIDVIRADFV